MAGRRQKDFRSGDLNEELGILLLKGLAAVASVPRPEDFGIDAVCTLLRQDDDDILYAENTFYVQVKSASVPKLKYQSHETTWLRHLKLPFFIGIVRKEESAIDLYGTHRLSEVHIESNYEEIELVLGPKPKFGFGMDPDIETAQEKFRSVNIGPPLLSWSIKDFSTTDFKNRAYTHLKTYLEAEQRNIDNRSINYIDHIAWNTNEPPDCNVASSARQGFSDEEYERILRSFIPFASVLKLRAFGRKDRDAQELVVKLIKYMRRNGIDVDPYGHQEHILEKWDV